MKRPRSHRRDHDATADPTALQTGQHDERSEDPHLVQVRHNKRNQRPHQRAYTTFDCNGSRRSRLASGYRHCCNLQSMLQYTCCLLLITRFCIHFIWMNGKSTLYSHPATPFLGSQRRRMPVSIPYDTFTSLRRPIAENEPLPPTTLALHNEKIRNKRRTRLVATESYNATATTYKRIELEESTRKHNIIEESIVDINKNWSTLCQQANLSSRSVVMITNILQQPIALPLALILKSKCGVKALIGVDDMLPNLPQVRIKRMDVLRTLKKSIPSLRFIAPVFTLVDSHDWTTTWISNQNLTHVIHLEHAMPIWDKNNISWDAYRFITMQTSTQNILQLVTALIDSGSKNNNRPSLIHVVRHVKHNTSQQQNKSLLDADYIMSSLAHNSRTASDKISVSTLQLPHVYGPLIGDDGQAAHEVLQSTDGLQQDTPSTVRIIYIDNAVKAILASLKPHGNIPVRNRLPDIYQSAQSVHTTDNYLELVNEELWLNMSREEKMTTAWNIESRFPFGEYKLHNLSFMQNTSLEIRQQYGLPIASLPCASQCRSTMVECSASVYDDIIPAGIGATNGCQYVVYIVALSLDIDELYKPASTGNDICRVAFVSGNSRLLERVKKMHEEGSDTNASTSWSVFSQRNGQIKIDGWKLVWLPDVDETTINDADYMLPLIDPSRLFAPSVRKAMFVDSKEFAEPSDDVLLSIILQIDRPSHGPTTRKEKRPGTDIRRWVGVPAEKARRVALFGGETKYLPSSPLEYADFALRSGQGVPDEQIEFYHQTDQYVSSSWLRSDGEIKRQSFDKFPFKWLSMSMLVHNLGVARARSLRCEWLAESLYWGSNRNIEELSLAYVLGRLHVLDDLGPSLAQEDGWFPFLSSADPKTRLIDERNSEVFLRVMTRRKE